MPELWLYPCGSGGVAMDTLDNHWTVDDATAAREILAAQLVSLAEKRLGAWKAELHRKFPRLHGEIIFGMGTDSVRIGGRQVDFLEDKRSLKGLASALEDVRRITGDYTDACPDDFVF